MKRFLLRQTQICLLIVCAMCTLGCWGLGEGLHFSRDDGKSTSRFRYEFEMVPNAVVMREDTEPQWQLGRYVFVRGADRVLVISRITSWSETATKKQRKSGDIPDMQDKILERLWITIPQGTAVGEELDMHALSYRFLANYDRNDVGSTQFARPFRVLGNVRVLEENDTQVRMRIRIRLTTDGATAWEVMENEITVPVVPDGKHALQAAPDAVIYPLSRPGELPSTGLTPVKLTPQMTDTPSTASTPPPDIQSANPSVEAQRDNGDGSKAAPPVNNTNDNNATSANPAAAAPPAMISGEPVGKQADNATNDAIAAAVAAADAAKPADESATLTGRWYNRTPAWEVFLQLNEDGSFIHSAARPLAVPSVIKGEWRVRGGYLVLRIQSFNIDKKSQMDKRKDNPYAMLKLQWSDKNNVVMDGDMPGPDDITGRYEMHRADFPDLNFIPAITYRPDSPEPRYIGQEPAKDSSSAKTTTDAKAPSPDASK